MSQHVSETCNESGGTWLPLTEYSVKSGISLSTIRRKIKSNSIPYRLENGRYLILYREGEESGMQHTTVPIVKSSQPASIPTERLSPQWNESSTVRHADSDESVHMLVEAFEHALKEKDQRIHLLEKLVGDLDERINELRLLVRVLEEKYEVRY